MSQVRRLKGAVARTHGTYVDARDFDNLLKETHALRELVPVLLDVAEITLNVAEGCIEEEHTDPTERDTALAALDPMRDFLRSVRRHRFLRDGQH